MNKETIVKLRKMGQHINILYVEDDEEISGQFETLFRKVFKNIDVVSDGIEGIKKYKEGFYDIVITDIEMPNMNGIELIQEIKKINENQLTVVTSAYNDSKYLQELIESGVEKFILKPFDMSKLFTDIAKIVSIIYNEKREKQLQEQLEEKMRLNQFLLDKMMTPLVVISKNSVEYKNEKFDEMFNLQCSLQSKDCYIATIFESEKISKLNNMDFIEYIELHSSEKLLTLRNGKVEHFKVVVSPIEGSSNSFISFVNTEVVSKEIERLTAQTKLDTLTQLYTREIFMQDIEIFLDSEQEYYAFCFGLKHLKEFVKLFGVSSLRDIYKILGVNLQKYFRSELEEGLISLYYFDTNHFVAVVPSNKHKEVIEMLKEFGSKFEYTNKLAKTYEPMYLDILDLKLNDSITVKQNIAEIENKLYMLNLSAF